jgi:catechol 2,3-dioxygenase-like lactoylglutathione lyase family enzyme
MIQKLSHATVYVLDMDKAYKVYTEKLGFEVRTDFTMDNGFRWLTVGPKSQPDVEIVLYKVQPGMALDEEGARSLKSILEKHGMGAGVLEADDCQKTYEELKARGIEFLSPPTPQPYGIEAVFRDGCGNWYSLTQSAKGANP